MRTFIPFAILAIFLPSAVQGYDMKSLTEFWSGQGKRAAKRPRLPKGVTTTEDDMNQKTNFTEAKQTIEQFYAPGGDAKRPPKDEHVPKPKLIVPEKFIEHFQSDISPDISLRDEKNRQVTGSFAAFVGASTRNNKDGTVTLPSNELLKEICDDFFAENKVLERKAAFKKAKDSLDKKNPPHGVSLGKKPNFEAWQIKVLLKEATDRKDEHYDEHYRLLKEATDKATKNAPKAVRRFRNRVHGA